MKHGEQFGLRLGGDAEAAAGRLIDEARRIARSGPLSPFVMPEVLLLAAIELAAQIDGTADGTIDWIRNVAARLDHPDRSDT